MIAPLSPLWALGWATYNGPKSASTSTAVACHWWRWCHKEHRDDYPSPIIRWIHDHGDAGDPRPARYRRAARVAAVRGFDTRDRIGAGRPGPAGERRADDAGAPAGRVGVAPHRRQRPQ